MALEVLAFAAATCWLAWHQGLGTIDGSHQPSDMLPASRRSGPAATTSP
jgi:hypothetical protein